jgi:SPP1 gp7 family putative phage head morphogenesis protein
MTAAEEYLRAAAPDISFITAWSTALEQVLNDAWSTGYSDKQNEVDSIDRSESGTATTFASKDFNLSWGNKEAARFHRLKAFASAIITDSDLSDAVKTSLADALDTGQSYRDWRKNVNQVFDDSGYSRLGSWQAETIYRTESSMAYGAGSYAKQLEVSDRFPFYEYSTAHDERVRAGHRALDGKIFKTDDQQYYPPLGFNCRCRSIPVSKLQAKKRGITGPDTVTPEMQSQLGNVEFIGDKIHLFETYLQDKLNRLDAVRAQMILDKIAELRKVAAVDVNTETTTTQTL